MEGHGKTKKISKEKNLRRIYEELRKEDYILSGILTAGGHNFRNSCTVSADSDTSGPWPVDYLCTTKAVVPADGARSADAPVRDVPTLDERDYSITLHCDFIDLGTYGSKKQDRELTTGIRLQQISVGPRPEACAADHFSLVLLALC
ncbi:hypothetical protein EVAR_36509_1 [Eumeta japonica]|uniref:Uncharacterized protein n=1 Tax=Eumeta variegata TaxID=151549 RepID=A0A4C1XBD4_EUMVA|nr:hypothetical protein EVAR_36509_1 [Eumeta japonica]